jgi:intracellular multiplication protein IcmL
MLTAPWFARCWRSITTAQPRTGDMQNQCTAVTRRLSDPDYQARLVSYSLALNLAMALLVAVMTAHATYVWLNPPKPQYFFVDGKTPPRLAVALDSPIVDDAELLQWTVKAVLATYNVNYHDYPEQLNTAGRRFTVNGWNSFAAAYLKSGNLEAMKRGRMLCYAQVPRAALINQTSVVAGHLSYEIQFPLVQTCQNTQQESTSNMMLIATVLRSDSQDHPDGLVVDRLVAIQH